MQRSEFCRKPGGGWGVVRRGALWFWFRHAPSTLHKQYITVAPTANHILDANPYEIVCYVEGPVHSLLVLESWVASNSGYTKPAAGSLSNRRTRPCCPSITYNFESAPCPVAPPVDSIYKSVSRIFLHDRPQSTLAPRIDEMILASFQGHLLRKTDLTSLHRFGSVQSSSYTALLPLSFLCCFRYLPLSER